MNCKVCLKEYNFSEQKPFTLLQCSHTYCLNCLKNIKNETNRCPDCREEIASLKPNFSILDLIESSQTTHNEKTSNELQDIVYCSANHKHPFRKSTIDDEWRCQGLKIFGNCKSNLDKEESYVGKTRYKCIDCYNFSLCDSCLKAPKKKDSNYFHSKIHKHKFNKCKRNNGWACNGRFVFGQCKSNLNQYNSSDCMTRYKCSVCDDYDLCQSCLDAQLPQKRTSSNHKHILTEWFGHKDKCKGGYLFKKCKSDSDSVKLFKCSQCYDFVLCEGCLNEPETQKYISPNHEHPFIQYYRANGWRCDGGSVFGKCKLGLGLNADENTRYKCTVCDDFDFCQNCLDSVLLEKVFSPNHAHFLMQWYRKEATCHGSYLFGECKSVKIPEPELDLDKSYICFNCDIILCELCKNEPELPSYISPNHEHSFIKYHKLNNWVCDGKTIFGKCRSNLHRNASGQERFKCTVCDDFDLCTQCLNTESITTFYDVFDISALFDEQTTQ